MSKEYFEQKFNEIPKEVLVKSVSHLKSIFSDDDKEYIREQIDTHGLHEWIHKIQDGFGHMGWGMAIRNELRSIGLTDDMLPDGNWDDYYVSVVEWGREMED